VSTCSDGYDHLINLSDNDNKCVKCDTSCYTCAYSSGTTCLKCKDLNYLNPDATCKTTCPDTYYKNNSNLLD
jgi:proprotein convertase subtilisin/kexin type 5